MAKRKSNISGTSRQSTKSTETQGEDTGNTSASGKKTAQEMSEQIKLAASLKNLYDEIEKIESKINELKKGGKKNLLEINNLLKERVKYQEKIIETEQKIKKFREDYKKDQKTTKKHQEETEKHQEETEKHQEKVKKNRKEINRGQEDYKKVEDQIRQIQQDLNVEMSLTGKMMELLGGNAADFAEQVKITNSLYDYQTRVIAQVPTVLQDQKTLSGEFLGIMDKTQVVANDIRSIEMEINKQVDDAAMGKYESINTDKLELDLARKRFEIESDLSRMTQKERELALDMLEQEQKALQALKDKNKALTEMSKKAEKTLKTFNKFADFDFKGGIKQAFGIETLTDNLKGKLGKAVVDVSAAIRSKRGLVGGFQEAGKAMGGIVKSALKLGAALAITGIITGLIGLGKMLFRALGAADQEAADLGKEFALSREQAGQLNIKARELADQMRIVGINAKEIVEGIKAAEEAFSGVDIPGQLLKGNKEMEKFVQQSAILSKQFGLSGEEIANIKDLSTVTNVPMDILVKQSDLLGKNTMGTRQSLKALAKIPKEVAIGFKGSTKELLAAAQKAKLLGLELKDIRDIGIKMLDIESSLEAEMEARVLTGKNLNLDAARYYALQGDVFHLQDELLSQVGSLEDFQKMNVIQQESLAAAVGMSVEQLGNVLTNAKKLKDADISPDYAESLSQLKSAEELEAELLDQRKKGASQAKLDYIQQMANDKRSASIKERFMDLLEKIKAKFSPILESILEMVHTFMDSAEGAGLIDGILDSIKKTVPKIQEFIKGTFGSVKEMLPKVIEFVGQLVSFGKEFFKSFGEKLPFYLEMFKTIGNIIFGFAEAIGPTNAAFAFLAFKLVGPKGVYEGLKFVGKKLIDIKKNSADIVTPEAGGGKKPKTPKTPKAGRAGRGGGGSMVSDFVNKIKPKNVLAIAAAMVLLSIALYITAKAFQEFAKVPWDGVAKGLIGMGALVAMGYFIGKIEKDIRKGAFAIILLAAATWVMGKALQEFASVSWDDVAKGIVSLGALALIGYLLGKVEKDMVLGAVAMILMAGALYVLGAALLLFNDVNWESLGKAAVALVGLAGAIFGLGAIISSGVGAVIFGAGVLGLIALGVAAGILGLGLQVLGNGIASIGNGLDSLFTQMSKLYDLDPEKFETIAEKIGILGKAISDIGSGSLKSAIGGGLSSLFGTDSPIEQITEIMTKLDASKVDGTSKAIRNLADTFTYFADKLKNIDVSGVEKSIEMVAKAKEATEGSSIMGSVGSTVKSAFSSFRSAIGLATGGNVKRPGITLVGENGPELVKLPGTSTVASTSATEQISGILSGMSSMSMSQERQVSQPITSIGETTIAAGDRTSSGVDTTNLEKKLDTLISVLSTVVSQPTIIKVGEKTVEEIGTVLNFKKNYNIGIDTGYGKVLT